MASSLEDAEPLSEPVLEYCWLDPWEQISVKYFRIKTLSLKKMHFRIASAKWRQFWFGLNVLTHWGLVRPYPWYHTSLSTLVPYWPVMNQSHRNISQWNYTCIWDWNIFIQKMHFKVLSAKWKPECSNLNLAPTVMSLLEALYLIEAPPNGSASCHKIVAPPQNRSTRHF